MKTNKIYQLGRHCLACGSSSNTDLVGKLIGDDKVAMILCDPPYGVSYVESKRGIAKLATDKVIANDNIEDEADYEKFTVAWLETIKPHLTPKNTVYIFNSDKMLLPTVATLKASGGKFAQLLIWAKTYAVLGRLILKSSSVNDVVFDGFVGSGSTLLACAQINRRCLAVELDPEYCQVVIERWEKLTSLKAEKLS